ncbi:Protein DBF4-like protein A [Bienertia sinuspersici]
MATPPLETLDDWRFLHRNTSMGARSENSDKLFTKVPIWIELPDLPVEFHVKKPLQGIGNHLGSFIRQDISELQKNKSRFARILIEVEADSPVPDFIWLGKLKQEIRLSNPHTHSNKVDGMGYVKGNKPHNPQSSATHATSGWNEVSRMKKKETSVNENPLLNLERNSNF